ncbi:MAG: hypothetical protein IJS86_04580 [Lachnospiraceae bacterium]|nr:hypothetical protein [Lachnospiraceae bacterium]
MMIRKGKRKIILFAALALLGMQVLFLIYTNLFCIPETMDNDVAKLFLHAMEIWNRKTVFLPAWHNQTTLEIDCPLLLAVPIYGLCGNIYLSFGIANILIAVLTLLVVYSILRQENISHPECILTCVMLLIPYSFGQLLSYNMTWFAGGQYSVKILTPLLLIFLLNDYDNRIRMWYVLAVICCMLNLVCGVSGGPYTFLSGSLPVMAGYFLSRLFTEKKGEKIAFVNRRILLCVAVTFFSVLGVAISRLMKVGSVSMSVRMISFDQVISSFFEVFRSYFEYLGGFPYSAVDVLSVQGIKYTLRGIWVILVSAGLIYYLRKIILGRLSLIGSKKNSPEKEIKIVFCLISVIIFNFVILWFTGMGSQPRYLAVAVTMVIIIEGLFFDRIAEKDLAETRLPVYAAYLAVWFLLFCIALLSDMDVLKGNCFPAMKAENERIAEVLEVLDDYDEKQVIFLEDTSAAEYARLTKYGNRKVYLAYNTEEDSFNYRGVIVNDYYMDLTDASNIAEDHILVVNKDITDIGELPGYIRDLYEETGECRDYVIYRSRKSLMDGVAGIRYNDHAVDFCFTDGYEIKNGEIDENGRLTATGDGGQIISGPLLGERSGSLDVGIYYTAKGEEDIAGRVEVWDVYSHEMTGSAELLTGSTKAEITGIPLDKRNLAVVVILDEGCEASVDRFEYDVKSGNA